MSVVRPDTARVPPIVALFVTARPVPAAVKDDRPANVAALETARVLEMVVAPETDSVPPILELALLMKPTRLVVRPNAVRVPEALTFPVASTLKVPAKALVEVAIKRASERRVEVVLPFVTNNAVES